MNLLKAVNNGRRGAETIQQPSPVFFTPEQEKRMVVGYQHKPDGKNVTTLDEAIQALKQAVETLTELSKTKERLKILLEVRETELAHTKAQLRECAKELCTICPDSGRDCRCDTCQWMPVKEEET